MNNRIPVMKTTSLILVALVALCLQAGCAASKKKNFEDTPVRTYRVGIVNTGVYSAIYNQALVDLGSYREIDLLTEGMLEKLFAENSVSTKYVIDAADFDQVARITGIDYLIVLVPAPAAYPSGHIGIKSINWVGKSINTEPAVKVPTSSYEWMLAANNGWVVFHTNPSGAVIYVDGERIGSSPVFLLPDHMEFQVEARWTEDVEKKELVRVVDQPRVIMVAPQEYLDKMNKKGLYERLQAADERHGEKFFIAFYLLVIIGGVVLLFVTPMDFIK